MPASSHHSFRAPANVNVRLWRYIDIPKLLDFLRTSSIHMTKLGNLHDPYEGRYPHHMLARVNAEYIRTERLCGRDPGDDAKFAEIVVEHVRSVVYVNCWCCAEVESEALWRIYSHAHGVAITTTFAKLAQSLPGDFFIGVVEYLDYERDELSSDNYFNLAMHKRSFFQHEREVRVVKQIAPVDFTQPPSAPGNTPSFLTAPVSFDAFSDIRVSPYAPSWFEPLVRDIVQRYDCPIPVVRSDMLK